MSNKVDIADLVDVAGNCDTESNLDQKTGKCIGAWRAKREIVSFRAVRVVPDVM